MSKSSEAYRTIGEASLELNVPTHVLRFWERHFPQLRPLKRSGGRRYYAPSDLALLRGLATLLRGEGYTIRGVRSLLQREGVGYVASCGRAEVDRSAPPAPSSRALAGLADELDQVAALLESGASR